MPVTWSQVRTWRAAPLGQAGDGLKQDADALERSRDQLRTQGIPGSWNGVARVIADARREGLVSRMTTHLEGKRTLQRALYDAESQVTEIERLVRAVEDTARSQQFTIAADGTVTDSADPPDWIDSRFEAEEYRQTRTNQAHAIADEITAILGKAAAADATIANGIPSGHVNDVDERGTISPEAAERWALLTDAERRAIIEEKIEELAEEYGIDDPEIRWEHLGTTNGSWSEGEGIVRLNIDNLDDPDILHTVAHELRHARQHEAVDDLDAWHFPWQDDPFDEHERDGITEEQAEEWEENFENYQSTSNGATFEEYYNQPVEEDARDAGREYVDNLTPEELDRLLEESR